MNAALILLALAVVIDTVLRARRIGRLADFYRRRAARPAVLSVLYPDPWLADDVMFAGRSEDAFTDWWI